MDRPQHAARSPLSHRCAADGGRQFSAKNLERITPRTLSGRRLRMEFTGRDQALTALIRHRFKGSRASDVLGPHKRLHLEHGPAELAALGHDHSNPGVYRTHAKRKAEGAFDRFEDAIDYLVGLRWEGAAE